MIQSFEDFAPDGMRFEFEALKLLRRTVLVFDSNMTKLRYYGRFISY